MLLLLLLLLLRSLVHPAEVQLYSQFPFLPTAVVTVICVCIATYCTAAATASVVIDVVVIGVPGSAARAVGFGVVTVVLFSQGHLPLLSLFVALCK